MFFSHFLYSQFDSFFFTKDRFYTLELLKNSIVGMNKLLQLSIFDTTKTFIF
ncbi:hypothetical protein LEP1GSC018_0157 [Leptospira kirschneri str. 2008720114]|uniref:Uncharacterized protein n=1 Tax=Leptospira kirschneri str. 200802841 TaxID=1193047 RepID=A0A828Y8V4_9LEPT|nr:hypothetical protein LEP1GSC131_0276 [Leptospira kirschneri str. 200802841]EKP04520.1 hypothetical protein LEP1GSC018_0157 [Leptospira kirschneri str. 2008720114]